MTAAPDAPNLGEQRGLSDETLRLFNVRPNGTGWLYSTKLTDGGCGTRWKSYSSTAPEDESGWAKYRWVPEKPPTARYFYPPPLSLTQAIADDGWGTLYLVGGEIAAMTMIEAGKTWSTCTFGDKNIPDELLSDLKAWKVSQLILIPDRDKSGELWAVTIRDLLKDQLDIELKVLALPFEVVDKHGKDVNDWWLALGKDKEKFAGALAELPEWRLPEPEPPPAFVPFRWEGETTDLPPRFIEDIERALNITGKPSDHDGWTKNICCPFHDDKRASAGWNRQSHVFHCFGQCGTKLAKEVGLHFDLKLSEYYDPIPTAKSSSSSVSVESAPTTTATLKEPAKSSTSKERALRPPLPGYIALTEGQIAEGAKGRGWLDEYLKWTRLACPGTPEIFHEAMALWALATISTRRMCFRLGIEEIYPNLYMIIVAKTSLYRKTTAMKAVRRLIQRAQLEPLLLPVEATPEALFDELAGVKPTNFDSLSQEEQKTWLLGRAVAAQRAFIKDECSSVFAALQRDYNQGLVEILLQGYDGDSGDMRKRLKSKGLTTVRDMCLSFLGATTPVMYAKHVGDEESQNGFTARFAIITPEGLPEYSEPGPAMDVPQSLLIPLRRMFLEVLPWQDGKRPGASPLIEAVVTPPADVCNADMEAVQALNLYRKALGFDLINQGIIGQEREAAYSRLGTMAIKVAMLLAAIEAERPIVRIAARHAYAAILVCERWRESLHRLSQDIARSSVTVESKVLDYIRSAGPDGVSKTNIVRDCGLKTAGTADPILRMLGEDGSIEQFQIPNGRGRPSLRYRIPLSVSE